ncbi:hypothetical protein IC229_16590 [Spirosoma sp. BT702]|uniref:Uncharacterized protein n=1 Tax=Spirosoma profusum TaxID=2771354 RepID=A0A926Y265_9BACT|nr:hypothetical protein [Spirosoma profusum]MBD2702273.1 hypothetical protein [Spirosoma profusum]
MKTIFLIIVFSLLAGYVAVAWYTGDWKAYQWNTDQSEAVKFIGGAVLVLLFILFRKKVNNFWRDR